MIEQIIECWYWLVDIKDVEVFNDIFVDNVVFYLLVVYILQEGKVIIKMYFIVVLYMFNNEYFCYEWEIFDGCNVVLEFIIVLDGIQFNGIDMIYCDEDGCIDDFKVMV